MKLFLFTFISLLFLGGCAVNSSSSENVRIENKLHKNIVCILGYNYPDLNFDFTSKQAIMANISRFEIDADQTKPVDTLGLCRKNSWDKYVKKNMLMVFIFDKDKLASAGKLEDALIERYYFSYVQLMNVNGVIRVN